jgi:hypothetical protein
MQLVSRAGCAAKTALSAVSKVVGTGGPDGAKIASTYISGRKEDAAQSKLQSNIKDIESRYAKYEQKAIGQGKEGLSLRQVNNKIGKISDEIASCSKSLGKISRMSNTVSKLAGPIGNIVDLGLSLFGNNIRQQDDQVKAKIYEKVKAENRAKSK